MVSKNDIKFVRSLHLKKNRIENATFFVEGAKNVEEAIQSNLDIVKIFTTETHLKSLPKAFTSKSILCKESDLVAMGTFESNNAALALIKFPEYQEIDTKKLTLVLDDISDPGNLGTIIRTADWYGIKDIVCSLQTTDCFSPKVANATMGSLNRVNVVYQNLQEFLNVSNRPIYGALLEGKDVNLCHLTPNGILIIGNEAKGISKPIESLVTQKIKIPGSGNAESLNAAIAAAILMHEFFKVF